jgi:hypothetical protein
MLNQPTLLSSAGLFILVYLGLLTLSLYFGNDYIRHMLPLYRWVILHLTQDYQIENLTLADNRGEGIVSLTLLTQYSVLGKQVIPPGVSISCSTLAGHAFQHPLLTLSLVFAWPASMTAQRIVRLCFALPFMLLLELLDIPLILLGSAQDLLMANFSPENYSIMIEWMNFMNGGGRPALSLSFAIMAVACSNFFSPVSIGNPKNNRPY